MHYFALVRGMTSFDWVLLLGVGILPRQCGLAAELIKKFDNITLLIS